MRAAKFHEVLAGGRTPSCQQRHLGRTTALLGAIPRACEWVKELSSATLPVSQEPLWGACLAELTGLPPQRAVQEPELRCPKARRMGQSIGIERETLSTDRVAGKRASQLASAAPVKSSRRSHPRSTRKVFACDQNLPRPVSKIVDLETLRKISNFTGTVPQPRSGMRAVPQPTSGGGAFSNSLASVRSIPLRAASAPAQEWIREIAAKASRPLIVTLAGRTAAKDRRKSVPATSQVLGTSCSELAPATASLSAEATPAVEQQLAAQWSSLCEGPSVPTEELARLAADVRFDSQTTSGPAAGLAKKRPQSATPSSFPTFPTSSGYVLDEPFANEADPLERFVAARSDALSPLEPLVNRTVPVAPVAQPLPSSHEQLPIARIPPTPGLVRHHGPWETTSGDDELNILAANIERILDEEARRHGIDV